MEVLFINIFPKDYQYDNPLVQDMITMIKEEVAKAGGEIIALEYDAGNIRIEVSSEEAGKALQIFGNKLALVKAVATLIKPSTQTE